jgi:hypothetical protein
MSTLEAAFGTQSPERGQARLLLALANATMASIVGAFTLGAAAAVIGALAMLLLPYLPLLWGRYLELTWPNKVACVGAFFFLGTIAGAFFWGIEFAFAIACDCWR